METIMNIVIRLEVRRGGERGETTLQMLRIVEAVRWGTSGYSVDCKCVKVSTLTKKKLKADLLRTSFLFP